MAPFLFLCNPNIHNMKLLFGGGGGGGVNNM